MPTKRKAKDATGAPTAPADFDTIGKRLRWAIERRPTKGRERGLRLFQRDMEARARELEAAGSDRVPPFTLPSIMTYLTDETEPSPTFVREAARLCGVKRSWIMFGDGPRTDGEPTIRAPGVSTQEDGWTLPWRTVAGLEGLAHAPHIVTAALAHHMDVWRAMHPVAADLADAEPAYLAALWSDIYTPHPLAWLDFADYAVHAITARTTALRIPTTTED
jgi:hypothetical protein